jgi:Emfourin
MKLTLQTSGGFAGIVGKPKSVDADKLSPDLREQFEQLVHNANLTQLPNNSPAPKGQADRMTYHLVVEDGGAARTLSISEAVLTPAVDAVVSFLHDHGD